MTAHAYDLLAARQDEPLGPAEDLFVRDHLASCAECNAFGRDVERADRLLRLREPEIAVPTQDMTKMGARDGALAMVTLAIALVVITAAGGLALREGRALQPGQEAASDLPAIGTSLGGVRFGDSPDDVIRVLGSPERQTIRGTQWVYGSGVLVLFSGLSLDASSRVAGFFVWQGSGTDFVTMEGFRLTNSGPSDFRLIYGGFSLNERVLTAPTTALGGVRTIVATGRDTDGTPVYVRGVFVGSVTESLEISRAPSSGVPRVSGPRALDPFAVSACAVIARAAPAAGLDLAGDVSAHGPFPPGVLATVGLLETARVCGYGDDRGWSDPHLAWIPRPSGERDVQIVLEQFLGAFREGRWDPAGAGRWVATFDHDRAVPSSRPFAAVATFLEPYLFIVTARDAETALRLSDAVQSVLP